MTAEQIRATLGAQGLNDAVIQPVIDRPDTFLIKLPLAGAGSTESEADVELGRQRVRTALNTFGPAKASAYEIIGTDAVGAVAGAELRNKAIAVTLAALVGMLVYIAFRFEWTYGAAAVIAVFHDVLVTLGFFSIFQWEVNLTVIAAFLTLVGASLTTPSSCSTACARTANCTGANPLQNHKRLDQSDAIADGHHPGPNRSFSSRDGDFRRRGSARILTGAAHRNRCRHLFFNRDRRPHHGLVGTEN